MNELEQAILESLKETGNYVDYEPSSIASDEFISAIYRIKLNYKKQITP